MPRARGTKQYQPLTLGLITEASPLDFPQGATVDERNFLFEHNGNKRVKRKGLKSRKALNYTLMHGTGNPLSVRVGIPFYWKKYDITVLPLIVQEASFTNVEFHFYNGAGSYLASFSTAGDISLPTSNVTFDEYEASVIKVDDERLVLNINFLSVVYFVDIEKNVGGTDVVCTRSVIYYRDFATLNTDGDPYARTPIVAGDPTVDINYQYNIANAGWVKNYTTINPAASSPLSGIFLAWSTDNTVRFPAMSDNVNSYIIRDDTTQNLVFDVQQYIDSSTTGFLAPRGSQVLSTDFAFGGRDIDDPTSETPKLPEELRFTL